MKQRDSNLMLYTVGEHELDKTTSKTLESQNSRF